MLPFYKWIIHFGNFQTNLLIKVNIFGLESENDEMGFSIAHMFAREQGNTVRLDRKLYDGLFQKIYYPVNQFFNVFA